MATRNGGAFVLVALCVSGLALRVAGAREPLMPAMYVLGDSTVDVGNNNFLPDCSAECRANYPRYGVDFPTHKPTGRFSNGYNLADQIAQFLGFTESPPAYASLPPERILGQMKTGINFASGGSGLQDQTGKHWRVYTMTDQLEKFTCAVQMMGNSSYDLISRSLVFISVGSNDLFEYVDGNATLSPSRNDTAFLQGLVAAYKSYLQELYAAGARKFSIVSPSMVGCCPSQRFAGAAKKDLDGYRCFGTANDLSRQLYPKLHSMLQDLSADLAGMNYSICHSAAMAETVLKHAASPTLSKPDGAGHGVLRRRRAVRDGKCTKFASVCPNRDNYLFWDGFHPTQAASAEAAFALVADQGLYVHPINLTRLAAL
ncbi:hypothetical protein QYE76_045479 [Lolium multiflorum]|uniref:GDSL esterase/lipase n=1 Tax=Lolium multiflorum TaxID=4521 RepID=A0AAD8WZU0_LOLMU|nr:hypothetical protein QYE76_045479 [Lolium multiflorum]